MLMKTLLFSILLLSLVGCAGMPTEDNLLQNVTKVVPLEEVDVTIHELGLWGSCSECAKWMGIPSAIACTGIIMYMPGCANVYWDEEGVPVKCDVFVPSESWDTLIEHELKHCQGMGH